MVISSAHNGIETVLSVHWAFALLNLLSTHREILYRLSQGI